MRRRRYVLSQSVSKTYDAFHIRTEQVKVFFPVLTTTLSRIRHLLGGGGSVGLQSLERNDGRGATGESHEGCAVYYT